MNSTCINKGPVAHVMPCYPLPTSTIVKVANINKYCNSDPYTNGPIYTMGHEP